MVRWRCGRCRSDCLIQVVTTIEIEGVVGELTWVDCHSNRTSLFFDIYSRSPGRVKALPWLIWTCGGAFWPRSTPSGGWTIATAATVTTSARPARWRLWRSVSGKRGDCGEADACFGAGEPSRDRRRFHDLRTALEFCSLISSGWHLFVFAQVLAGTASTFQEGSLPRIGTPGNVYDLASRRRHHHNANDVDRSRRSQRKGFAKVFFGWWCRMSISLPQMNCSHR